MRIVAVFAIVIVAVVAEYCHRDSDCQLTDCGSGFRLDCYDNVCTCIGHTSYNCTMATQCSTNFGACKYHDHHWHCVDNICRCRTYSTHD